MNVRFTSIRDVVSAQIGPWEVNADVRFAPCVPLTGSKGCRQRIDLTTASAPQ